MPMNNDPVLNRPMFNNALAPTVQPFQAKGTGITSNVVNPDEGAKQLINTFGGAGMAGMSGPGYAGGGSVRHFKIGGYNDSSSGDIPVFVPEVPPIVDESKTVEGAGAPYVPRTPAGRFLYEPFAVTPKKIEAVDKKAEENSVTAREEKVRAENPPPSILEEMSDEEYQNAMKERQRKIDAVRQKSDGANYYESMAGVDRRAPISSRTGNEEYGPPMPSPEAPAKKGEEQGPPMPTKAGERDKRAGKGGLDLLLEDIKNRRAASAEEKENNKWMALMQAGLAIMGGRSSNAMQNIGAGGQQGAQAFAASEKDRRAEDRSLFSEEAQVRLAQEKLAESADERAAQREMLTSRERERLQERVSDREARINDRALERERAERATGIASINAIASQTRQELRDISIANENIERDIIKYRAEAGKGMMDPNEAKSEIEKLERRRQDLNDRYREVIERQDSVLGRQGQKVPDRGPPSISLSDGKTGRYAGYSPK